MSEITIESGIPIPPKHKGTGYPELMRQMKVGDSILVPKKGRVAVLQAAVRLRITITTRKEGDGTMRCWKVSDTRKDT